MTKNIFKQKLWWAVTIIMILGMILTACAQPTPAPEEPEEPPAAEPTAEPEMEEPEMAEEATLVYAAEGDIRSLDPMYINNRLDMSIIMHIFDMLGYRDRMGVTQPQAAESWEQVDPNTWEFKLRKGVMFSNGEEMTSEDVAYSMERAQQEEFNNFYQLPAQTGLKEVKIIDDYTFQLITEEPSLTMEFWLAEAPIVPKGYYSENPADEVSVNPVGSGPYKFVEWVKDDHITIEANEDYWGGAPEIKTITFRVIPEESSRLNELRAGNVDVAPSISLDQADLANSDVSHLVAMEGLRKMNLQISQTSAQEALKDKKVRHALNYAVDKQTIIETLLSGYTSELKSYVNPPNNNPDLEPYEYDPEKAKQLLAEAGYPDGFDVIVEARPSRYGLDKEVVLAVAKNLEDVGINPDVQFVESGLFIDALDNKEFKGLAYIGWAALINPLVENLILTCDHIDNGSQYCNPEFDALYNEANQTVDPDARHELVLQMQEIAWDDAPWIFLWRLPVLFGVSNDIDWEPRNDGYINTWEAKPAK